MDKLIIWLVYHQDVKVRFNYDSILDCLHIRVIRGRFIAERLIDPLRELVDSEKFVIAVLNDLYDGLEKEEKEYDSQ